MCCFSIRMKHETECCGSLFIVAMITQSFFMFAYSMLKSISIFRRVTAGYQTVKTILVKILNSIVLGSSSLFRDRKDYNLPNVRDV